MLSKSKFPVELFVKLIGVGALHVTEALEVKMAVGKLEVTDIKFGMVIFAKQPFASAIESTGLNVPAEA